MVCRCSHAPVGKLSVTQQISWGPRTRLGTTSPPCPPRTARERRSHRLNPRPGGPGRRKQTSKAAVAPRWARRPPGSAPPSARVPFRIPPHLGPQVPARAHAAPPSAADSPRVLAAATQPHKDPDRAALRGPEGPRRARAGSGGAWRESPGEGASGLRWPEAAERREPEVGVGSGPSQGSRGRKHRE